MNNKKPVTFIQGGRGFYRRNEYAQNLLLKALSEGITDPQELKKAAGLSRVADVYRSLDKLAIRKEYHEALAKNNVDLDFIVSGFKDLAANGSDKIKLGSLSALLKSIGLDKYEKQEDSGKSWEEEIMRISEKKHDIIEGQIAESSESVIEEYDVIVPDIPPEERKRQVDEQSLGRELYG